jgi:hypothetical protein
LGKNPVEAGRDPPRASHVFLCEITSHVAWPVDFVCDQLSHRCAILNVGHLPFSRTIRHHEQLSRPHRPDAFENSPRVIRTIEND